MKPSCGLPGASTCSPRTETKPSFRFLSPWTAIRRVGLRLLGTQLTHRLYLVGLFERDDAMLAFHLTSSSVFSFGTAIFLHVVLGK